MNFKSLTLLTAGFFAIINAQATQVFAHGDESRVEVELESQATVPAGTTSLQFQLIDSLKKITLTDANLNVVHEKKLHLFIFDPALMEFRHEHPAYTQGAWRVTTVLPKNGNYWIWTQGEISSDSAEFTANTRLTVTGGLPENSMPPALGDVRTGTDTNSKIALSNQVIRAKKTVMLPLTFSRVDGSNPNITPYLGARAHVLIVTDDGDSILHVHPMDGSTPNQLMLHTSFPSAGNYRIWVQFLDNAVLKTVALSVKVKP